MFHNLCVKLRFNFQRQLCKLLSEGKCARVRAIKVAQGYLSAGNEVQALSPDRYLFFRKLNLQKLPDHAGNMYVMYSRCSTCIYISPEMDSQPPFFFVGLLSDYSSWSSLSAQYVICCFVPSPVYVQVVSHVHFQRWMPPHLHSLGFIICTL